MLGQFPKKSKIDLNCLHKLVNATLPVVEVQRTFEKKEITFRISPQNIAFSFSKAESRDDLKKLLVKSSQN
jgi:hypothetical protein